MDNVVSDDLCELVINHTINAYKKSTISWLLLLLLTVLSIYVGALVDVFTAPKGTFITVVLFIVFLKGQQLVDIFMELKLAPALWRRLLLAYVIFIPAIIAMIYLL